MIRVSTNMGAFGVMNTYKNVGKNWPYLLQ